MPVNRLSLGSGTITSAGAQTGVAVGSITGDYTIKLLITSFLAGTARIAIEEATSNAFSPAEQLVVWNFPGGFNNPEGQIVSFRKREAAGTDLFGTPGAFARLNLQELNGYGSPSIAYDAWIEF